AAERFERDPKGHDGRHIFAISLPSPAAGWCWSTTAIAAATNAAAAESSRKPASGRPHERREPEVGRGTGGLVAGHDVGDELHAFFEVALHELGGLTVRDAEPDQCRLELLVEVNPDTPGRFDARQRSEERVDR